MLNTQLNGSATNEYLPWKKTLFKDQTKIANTYGPGYSNAIEKIRFNSTASDKFPPVRVEAVQQSPTAAGGTSNQIN